MAYKLCSCVRIVVQGRVRTQNIREVAIVPAKTVNKRVSRESRATPALALDKVESFEARFGSSPEVVLFTGVGEGSVIDVLVAGSPGEMVCM